MSAPVPAQPELLAQGDNPTPVNAHTPPPPFRPSSALLDHAYYPHIMDSIISFADHAALLKLRATSWAMCKRADSILARHVVIHTADIMTQEHVGVVAPRSLGIPGFRPPSWVTRPGIRFAPPIPITALRDKSQYDLPKPARNRDYLEEIDHDKERVARTRVNQIVKNAYAVTFSGTCRTLDEGKTNHFLTSALSSARVVRFCPNLHKIFPRQTLLRSFAQSARTVVLFLGNVKPHDWETWKIPSGVTKLVLNLAQGLEEMMRQKMRYYAVLPEFTFPDSLVEIVILTSPNYESSIVMSQGEQRSRVGGILSSLLYDICGNKAQVQVTVVDSPDFEATAVRQEIVNSFELKVDRSLYNWELWTAERADEIKRSLRIISADEYCKTLSEDDYHLETEVERYELPKQVVREDATRTEAL